MINNEGYWTHASLPNVYIADTHHYRLSTPILWSSKVDKFHSPHPHPPHLVCRSYRNRNQRVWTQGTILEDLVTDSQEGRITGYALQNSLVGTSDNTAQRIEETNFTDYGRAINTGRERVGVREIDVMHVDKSALVVEGGADIRRSEAG